MVLLQANQLFIAIWVGFFCNKMVICIFYCLLIKNVLFPSSDSRIHTENGSVEWILYTYTQSDSAINEYGTVQIAWHIMFIYF